MTWPDGYKNTTNVRDQAPAFFKVVVASTVSLRDFYHYGQLPFRAQIHRPDRVPVTCFT